MVDSRSTLSIADPVEFVISLGGIAKTYESRGMSVQALTPIDFDFKHGETVAVVGPSGCGKSTLLRIVSGLEWPTSGELRVNGELQTGPVPGVGYVFQEDLLLEWKTVLENVLLPAKIKGKILKSTRARADALLKDLEMEDFADRYAWELSGGMRQRVAIARALLLEPSLLFLDEPFSALDALTRDQMNMTLQTLALTGTSTTLLITHSIPEAIFTADRVVVMSPRPGTILEEIEVPFPRPRGLEIRETPEFIALTRRVRQLFEQAGVFSK